MTKKKQSAAAKARATFDPDPPPLTDDVLLERIRALVEKARPPPKRLLSAKDVMERTGLTYPTIWARMQAGTFPRAREISNNKLGWIEEEIDEFIDNLPVRKLKGDEVVNEEA